MLLLAVVVWQLKFGWSLFCFSTFLLLVCVSHTTEKDNCCAPLSAVARNNNTNTHIQNTTTTTTVVAATRERERERAPKTYWSYLYSHYCARACVNALCVHRREYRVQSTEHDVRVSVCCFFLFVWSMKYSTSLCTTTIYCCYYYLYCYKLFCCVGEFCGWNVLHIISRHCHRRHSELASALSAHTHTLTLNKQSTFSRSTI